MIYRLSSYFNGLGDNLQLSTLPEELTKQGHEVYLLKDTSNQVHQFRNNKIKEFVWGSNPFIKGELEGVWNCGDLLDLYTNPNKNFIKNWETVHGLIPKNSFPKLYMKPNPVKDIIGIIELSSISLKYNEDEVKYIVKKIIDSFPGFTFKQIVSPNQNSRIHIKNVDMLEITSLFELYDITCGCNCFISLNSGSHSVAAASVEHNKSMLRYCIMPASEYHSMMRANLFIYPGTVYLREDEEF